MNYQNPLLPALFSIDLEQEARIDDQEERLENLEQVLEGREADREREVRHEGGGQ